MFLRVIRGKLKSGKWDEYERAYLAAVEAAGPVEGLCGRWLTRDIDDPDCGTTISLWASVEAMQAYEKSDLLKNKIQARLTPYFSGQYETARSRVRFAEGDPSPDEWFGTDN